MGGVIRGMPQVESFVPNAAYENVAPNLDSTQRDTVYFTNSSQNRNVIYNPVATTGCRNFVVQTEQGDEIDTCYYDGMDLGVIDSSTRLQRMGTAKEVDADVMAASSKVVPSTVKINVKGAKGQSWSGSGYILNHDYVASKFPGIEMEAGTYYIMTNHHVASESKEITVISADKKYKFKAEIVKRNGAELMDKQSDCALLKIKTDVVLQAVEIASYEDLNQGETLLTAGYPLGLPNVSVTKGIVSQVRQETGEPLLAIQTDAEINPGNSGGPLFTLDGKVVGTNTYSFRDTNGLSFAISTVEQIDLLSKIWTEGRIQRGDIGISFKPLDSATAYASGLPSDTTGAIIASVEPATGAFYAGVQRGDILTSIDVLDDSGNVVRRIEVDLQEGFELTSLMSQIYNLQPNANVKLNLLRKQMMDGGKYSFVNIEAKINVSEYAPPQYVDASGWGFTAIDDEKGLVILDIRPDSPADKQGVEPGSWIITGIKSPDLLDFTTQTVKSSENLQEMINYLDEKGAREITIYLQDYWNPKIVKRVTLTRGIDDSLLAIMFKSGQMLGSA